MTDGEGERATDDDAPRLVSAGAEWVVLAVAFVARVVGAVARVRGGYVDPDESAFAGLARTLATTGRFSMSPTASPEVIRGPSYVAWLSLQERLLGPRELPLLAVQALVGAGVAWLCARELGRILARTQLTPVWQRRLWWLGALLLALSPFAVFYERLLLSEGFATAATVAGTFAFLRALERRSWKWALVAGVAFALLTLAKPALMALPIFLALVGAVGWRRSGATSALTTSAAVVIVAFALVAPWTARNWTLLHRFVPVGIGGGTYIYLAMQPADENGVTHPSPDDRRLLDRYLDPNLSTEERVAIDDDFRRRGKEAIAAHPATFVRLAAMRPFRLWVSSHAGELKTPPPRLIRLGIAFGALVLVLLATVAPFVVARPLRPTVALLWTVPAYVTAAHTPIMSGGRYAVPAWPLVIVLAITALAALMAKRQASVASAS